METHRKSDNNFSLINIYSDKSVFTPEKKTSTTFASRKSARRQSKWVTLKYNFLTRSEQVFSKFRKRFLEYDKMVNEIWHTVKIQIQTCKFLARWIPWSPKTFRRKSKTLALESSVKPYVFCFKALTKPQSFLEEGFPRYERAYFHCSNCLVFSKNLFFRCTVLNLNLTQEFRQETQHKIPSPPNGVSNTIKRVFWLAAIVTNLAIGLK